MKNTLAIFAAAILVACSGSGPLPSDPLPVNGLYIGEAGGEAATVIIDGTDFWMTYGGTRASRLQYWVSFGSVETTTDKISGEVYDAGAETRAQVELAITDSEAYAVNGKITADTWEKEVAFTKATNATELSPRNYHALMTRLVPFHSNHTRVTFQVLPDGTLSGNTESGCKVDGRIEYKQDEYSHITLMFVSAGCDDQKFTGVIFRVEDGHRALLKSGGDALSIFIF
jgi:hypothetical protein